MRVVTGKWNHDATVGIPTAVPEAAQVGLDQPLQPQQFGRDIMIAAITDDNRHEPVATGHPVGNEVW